MRPEGNGPGGVLRLALPIENSFGRKCTVPISKSTSSTSSTRSSLQREVAYLTDRVAVQAGRPQRYGSQFKIRDDGIVFDPIEDSATVDERRAALGLPPLAEYARQGDSRFAPRR